MLIHERFVFLHMPKTGGSFVATALKRELPPGSLAAGAPGKMHPGWNDIPDDARNRPALIYVRNPWDWYVSWYHAVLANWPDDWGPLPKTLGDFETALREACTGAIDPDGRLPPPDRRQDFYTTRLRRACADGFDSERLVFGRFESLLEDLDRFLGTVGVALSDAAMRRLREAEPRNSSEHLPYREYYDDGLRDLVADSCSMLIERFDYRF